MAGISARSAQTLSWSGEPANIIRSWGVPTPFTPDEEPIIGWVPERDNLFVAAGFMQTITIGSGRQCLDGTDDPGRRLTRRSERLFPARFHMN